MARSKSATRLVRPLTNSFSQTTRLIDSLSGDEPSVGGALFVSVRPLSEIGGVAAGKRFAMPAGSSPPSFLAMPGGRSRPRRESPGGTSFDTPDDCGCKGAAVEMCIYDSNPVPNYRPTRLTRVECTAAKSTHYDVAGAATEIHWGYGDGA